MTFTIRGVEIRHGATTTHNHFGYKISVTPVLLATTCKGFAAGTRIGTIQSKRFRAKFGGRVTESATFSDKCAVLGHDYDWLVREFAENQGGERQARLARIQPGRRYVITHMFGYLSHDPCIYEKGTCLEVKEIAAGFVATRVFRSGSQPADARWARDCFESLVTMFTIIEDRTWPAVADNEQTNPLHYD